MASPEYDRPWEPTPEQQNIDPLAVPPSLSPLATLQKLMGTPDLASKRWIWEQYDHLVMSDTVIRPGGDAALVRVRDTKHALAIATDCTPRYCLADPVRGGMQAVAETWRNICAVGARPLAITDNMNFGNPTNPRIMGQFVGAIDGIRQACIALDYPVVSGNVSLYNETAGSAILPTPAIGGVGLIDDFTKAVGIAYRDGDTLILIGETKGHLGQSIYLREMAGREDGAPPPVDLDAERGHGEFVRDLINARSVSACHDISDGGLLVALAEMALAANIGADIMNKAGDLAMHAWCFGEDQARYIVAAGRSSVVLEEAQKRGIPAMVIGRSGGVALTLKGERLLLDELRETHEGWLPNYMAVA